MYGSRCLTKPCDKTNKMTYAPREDSDQPGHPSVWSESSLSAWRNLGTLATIECTAKTLIRLGGCPGWSESSLGAKVILLVLSCDGSYHAWIFLNLLSSFKGNFKWHQIKLCMIYLTTVHDCKRLLKLEQTCIHNDYGLQYKDWI